MGQELIIPDSFKTMAPAKAFAMLNPQEDNLADGIGQSYGVIRYRGKQWSLRYRGQEYPFMMALGDGTQTYASYLDVIILSQPGVKSKSYYLKYLPGQSDGEAPLCSSINGVTPDAGVRQMQAQACGICPRNVWKTDPQTGRKGRECQDYKRLAVLLMPAATQKMLGEALLEPVFLRVPPASLNSLAIMGETMAAQGYHYSAYITRITFDPQAPHPQMQFRPLQGVTDEEAPAVMKIRNDPLVQRITVGDGGQTAALPGPQNGPTLQTAPAPIQAPQSPAALPPSAPVITLEAQRVAETAPPSPANTFVQPVTGLAQPASPTSAVPAASPPEGQVTTGLSGGATLASLTPQQQAQSVAQPAGQTQADVGVTTESDTDLDNRIAALLNKRTAA